MSILNPPQIGYIQLRHIEKILLGYFLCTALLFLLIPAALASPVYEPWKELGQMAWGKALLFFVFMHSIALFWNGRNPVLSRSFRSLTLTGYIYISMKFGFFFLEGGAIWGAILHFYLLPILTGALLLRVVNEAKMFKIRG